jgi:glyoxylase-like metal-dependent hydrolase (beta-lactamase superfamily II)
VRIGDLEIEPVLDAVGLLGDLDEAYPDTPADEWEPYRALYPELFRGSSWRLPCASYLVRSEDATILVDTGVGPPGLWDWTAEDEGGLPPALDELGVARDAVDIVFLTHLHIDHLGWNADLEGVPFFPRARYVVHRDAVAFARTRSELPHIRRCVEPLLDRFELVAEDVELAPGVTAFLAPGHYPGHMALRLASGERRAVLLADTAVHPAMLDRPDLAYVSDVDGPASIETRRAILSELVDEDVVVACGHYPGNGIGRVVRRGDRVVWEAV